MTLKEDVASAKVQGELPIGLSAGPIAAAAGLVYRSEWGQTINCGYNCNNVLYNLGNFAEFGPASYNIKEGSAEINVPILKDQGRRACPSMPPPASATTAPAAPSQPTSSVWSAK